MKRRKLNEPQSFIYRHLGRHATLLTNSTGGGATMRGDPTNSCEGDHLELILFFFCLFVCFFFLPHRDLGCPLDDYILDNLCLISCSERPRLLLRGSLVRTLGNFQTRHPVQKQLKVNLNIFEMQNTFQ